MKTPMPKIETATAGPFRGDRYGDHDGQDSACESGYVL